MIVLFDDVICKYKLYLHIIIEFCETKQVLKYKLRWFRKENCGGAYYYLYYRRGSNIATHQFKSHFDSCSFNLFVRQLDKLTTFCIP